MDIISLEGNEIYIYTGREEIDGGHLANKLLNLPRFVAAQFLKMDNKRQIIHSDS